MSRDHRPAGRRAAMAAQLICLILPLCAAAAARAEPPAAYDLRDVAGDSYVTPIKTQLDGTCWAHAAVAAMESNLLVTGNWAADGQSGLPSLAEYHMDWWNGFNQWHNDDAPPQGTELAVHWGGDYLVAAAYAARGEGPVRNADGQSYGIAPPRMHWSFATWYPWHIEWYTLGADLSGIDALKQAVMDHGAVGTCLYWGAAGTFYRPATATHYQPQADARYPDHAVAIVGWDDAHPVAGAPGPGAWLCKNSLGSAWGDGGYFWVSYHDKWAARHPKLGAVSFRDVRRGAWEQVYYHDTHGWRGALSGVARAVNVFTATDHHDIAALSFVTTEDDVGYTATVYDRFEGGMLLEPLATVGGTFARRGMHTVELPSPAYVTPGNTFFVCLETSNAEQAYDATSEVNVLLGDVQSVAVVPSAADAGQSYYWNGSHWVDLTEYLPDANFCTKALAVPHAWAITLQFDSLFDDGPSPGWVFQNAEVATGDRHAAELTIVMTAENLPGEPYEVTLTDLEEAGFVFEPTSDPLVWLIRGGRADSTFAREQPYPILVEVFGQTSGGYGAGQAQVVLRRLGDADGDGSVGGADKQALNNRLNGVADPGIPARALDFDGDGSVGGADKLILNSCLNGSTVP